MKVPFRYTTGQHARNTVVMDYAFANILQRLGHGEIVEDPAAKSVETKPVATAAVAPVQAPAPQTPVVDSHTGEANKLPVSTSSPGSRSNSRNNHGSGNGSGNNGRRR
jgi:hypothetical protein